jgi:GntR family transcriptional repressor for pyruvate dehydrogenase complex
MQEKSNKSGPVWETAVRSESLSWSIVRQIRDALFSGKLKPGDFLGSEISLGQQFGVSRVASRDALRALIAMGIVEVRMGSRGGAWVAQGDSERLVDALSIQLHLIGLTPGELLEAQSATSVAAAALAAGRATPEDADNMRAAARDTEQAASDPHTFTAASMRFRESIVRASKNRLLIAQYRAFGSVLGPLLEANTTPAATRKVIRSNAALLKAITAGDAATAAELMRERESGIQTRILGSTATDGRPAHS